MLRSLSRQARRAAELDTGCWSRGFASEIGNNKKGEELAKRENLKSRETHPDTPSTRSDIIPQVPSVASNRFCRHSTATAERCGCVQTFAGDYRSSSGLGLGDNIHNHTDKWLDVRHPLGARPLLCMRAGLSDTELCLCQVDEYYTGNTKPPMQYCEEIQPIKVHGQVVASYGSAPCLAPRLRALQEQLHCERSSVEAGWPLSAV